VNGVLPETKIRFPTLTAGESGTLGLATLSLVMICFAT
jgi:hypothetical protein